jgi:hypothetical protein
MYEGHKISHRTIRFIRFDITVGTRGTEFCVSIIRKREIWEAGLHCTSLGKGGRPRELVKCVRPVKELTRRTRTTTSSRGSKDWVALRIGITSPFLKSGLSGQWRNNTDGRWLTIVLAYVPIAEDMPTDMLSGRSLSPPGDH